MVIEQTEDIDAGTLEITLKGEAIAVIKALVNGLPREALMRLQDQLAAELQKRHDGK